MHIGSPHEEATPKHKVKQTFGDNAPRFILLVRSKQGNKAMS